MDSRPQPLPAPGPRTTVVHLKRRGGVVVQDCDVYIGRPMYQGGWRLPGSKWANPFRLKAPGDRRRVLDAYRAHVRADPSLLAALPELRGKRLGCWCVEPRCLVCGGVRARDGGYPCGHVQCHGQVLIELLAELDSGLTPPPDGPPPPDPIADDDPLWDELGI